MTATDVHIKDVKIEEKDYANFLMNTGRKQLAFMFLFVIVISLAIGNINSSKSAWLIVPFTTPFFVFAYVMGIKYRAHKEITNNKLLNKSCSYNFDKSGLLTTSESGQNKVSWGEIYKVIETNAVFGIFISPCIAYILPKRYVSSGSDLKTLQELFSGNMPANKFKFIKFFSVPSIMKTTEDTYSYKGWLVSDRFIKRIVAMYMYIFVLWIFSFILTLTVMLASKLLSK